MFGSCVEGNHLTFWKEFLSHLIGLRCLSVTRMGIDMVSNTLLKSRNSVKPITICIPIIQIQKSISKSLREVNASYFFNFLARWKSSNDIPAKSRGECSIRLLPTKNPARSFSCPGCQVRGPNGSRGLGRQVTASTVHNPGIKLN